MAGPTVPQDFLKAENVGLQQRETADRLQKLILEELHHRIKNTLATVSAIASQSLRTATSIEHGQHAIESRTPSNRPIERKFKPSGVPVSQRS